MKCLANIMLLDKATRQIFVDLGYAPKAADRLRVSWQIKYGGCRLTKSRATTARTSS